jgi:hypothetical protein
VQQADLRSATSRLLARLYWHEPFDAAANVWNPVVKSCYMSNFGYLHEELAQIQMQFAQIVAQRLPKGYI